MEKRYSISDAARQVGVEAHVLRYWEEELGFEIPRNSQGHRYYREVDMTLLKRIKDLKEQGFQLRAIKMLMPDMGKIENMSGQELYSLREELNQRVQMEEEQKASRSKMARVMPMPTKRTVDGGLQSPSHHAKWEQFESLMRNLIRDTLQEQQEMSEQRISEAVSERMIKEMDYLMREKEDMQERFQEKQIELLQQILVELRPVEKEAAASGESTGALLSKRKNNKTGNKPKKFRFGF